MKLALVGATGLVGREMIEVLEERQIKIDEFIPVASERSVGKIVVLNGKDYTIHSMQGAIDKAPDLFGTPQARGNFFHCRRCID